MSEESIKMSEESKIKADLYNKFYEENKELYKRNPQEFARQENEYVSRKYSNIKYKMKESKNE